MEAELSLVMTDASVDVLRDNLATAKTAIAAGVAYYVNVDEDDVMVRTITIPLRRLEPDGRRLGTTSLNAATAVRGTSTSMESSWSKLQSVMDGAPGATTQLLNALKAKVAEELPDVALALAVTIQVIRHCYKSFRLLAGQVWLFQYL